jgi:inositol hexakisphosphate/diphosphoinositol-pentakisphosphate kinase
MENPHGTTTATSSLSVTTSSQNGSLGTKASPTQLLFPQDQAASNQSASPSAAPVHPAPSLTQPDGPEAHQRKHGYEQQPG